MFKLRNINTDESIKALAQGTRFTEKVISNFYAKKRSIEKFEKKISMSLGLYCEDSALFRHEIAYVLGQVQSPVAIKELKDRLLLEEEVG